MAVLAVVAAVVAVYLAFTAFQQSTAKKLVIVGPAGIRDLGVAPAKKFSEKYGVQFPYSAS